MFDGRTLNHQSSYSTVSPSSRSCLPSAYRAASSSIFACWSSTVELISPDATYRRNGFSSSDRGVPAFDISSSTRSPAISPESAR